MNYLQVNKFTMTVSHFGSVELHVSCSYIHSTLCTAGKGTTIDISPVGVVVTEEVLVQGKAGTEVD